MMKKIEFFHAKDLPFRKVADFAPAGFLNALSEAERQTEVKTHFSGSADQPFLMEIKDVPNMQATHHAHEKNEIFFVLEGELHFGQHICVAGDSISILANTLYTFRTGPAGCRYLKFTGEADNSFIMKDRYQAMNSGKAADNAAHC